MPKGEMLNFGQPEKAPEKRDDTVVIKKTHERIKRKTENKLTDEQKMLVGEYLQAKKKRDKEKMTELQTTALIDHGIALEKLVDDTINVEITKQKERQKTEELRQTINKMLPVQEQPKSNTLDDFKKKIIDYKEKKDEKKFHQINKTIADIKPEHDPDWQYDKNSPLVNLPNASKFEKEATKDNKVLSPFDDFIDKKSEKTTKQYLEEDKDKQAIKGNWFSRWMTSREERKNEAKAEKFDAKGTPLRFLRTEAKQANKETVADKEAGKYEREGLIKKFMDETTDLRRIVETIKLGIFSSVKIDEETGEFKNLPGGTIDMVRNYLLADRERLANKGKTDAVNKIVDQLEALEGYDKKYKELEANLAQIK